ncbi:MAG: TIGR02996 domain-containing protein [Planctomycetes bacterium]|nr:TIGR02996 domain-containing protein [Planctomycetota bacterium]
MSDQLALLAAIRDTPDEDTPRLAYADWLDEHATSDADRARAEFIRLNCEVIRLNGAFQSPEYTEHWWSLANRLTELVEEHQEKWFAAFPFQKTLEAKELWKGFPRHLEISAAKCLTTPRPPWELEPGLTARLTGSTDDLRRVIESGWLDGVESLYLKQDNSVDGDALATVVANSTCAPNLRWLFFLNDNLSDVGARAIGESTKFSRLRRLDLAGAFATDGWAAALNSPFVSQLETLSLVCLRTTQSRPGFEAATILAASTRLAHLKELLITRSRIGTAGIRAIVTSPYLQNLQLLTFGQEDFDATAGEAFTPAILPKLEKLQISDSNFSDVAVTSVAKSSLMKQLVHLDLSGNPLTSDGIEDLVGTGSLPRLESLCLDESRIGDGGAKALAKSPHLNLAALELANCGIGSKGMKALAAAPWADRLVKLNLRGNSITKASVGALTSGNFASLRRLQLEGTVRSGDLKTKLTGRFGDVVDL